MVILLLLLLIAAGAAFIPRWLASRPAVEPGQVERPLVPVIAPPSEPGGQPRVSYVPAPPRTDAFATISLVSGLVGGCLVAIVFGHMAMIRIRRTGDDGSGMALAGLILGYLVLVVAIIVIIANIVALSGR